MFTKHVSKCFTTTKKKYINYSLYMCFYCIVNPFHFNRVVVLVKVITIVFFFVFCQEKITDNYDSFILIMAKYIF